VATNSPPNRVPSYALPIVGASQAAPPSTRPTPVCDRLLLSDGGKRVEKDGKPDILHFIHICTSSYNTDTHHICMCVCARESLHHYSAVYIHTDINVNCQKLSINIYISNTRSGTENINNKPREKKLSMEANLNRGGQVHKSGRVCEGERERKAISGFCVKTKIANFTTQHSVVFPGTGNYGLANR
jgi:hypothetical protein